MGTECYTEVLNHYNVYLKLVSYCMFTNRNVNKNLKNKKNK